MNERRSVKFAGIRFTEGEYASIQAAIMSSGLDASKWLRNRILNTPLPGSASIPPSVHIPSKATPAAISTPATRKSTSINMSNLGDFYGQKH